MVFTKVHLVVCFQVRTGPDFHILEESRWTLSTP